MDSKYGGKVIILPETTKNPISFCGEVSGICYGSDTSNQEKNFKRGLDCLRSGHGRVLEYSQIYLVLDGWSARVIREFGRHIGGMPTYLQASTRYIDYKNFEYYTPDTIKNNRLANEKYNNCMAYISEIIEYLEKECDIKKEDVANLLPLGMKTKIVYRTNLRGLVDMAKVRKCTRAYKEYRILFQCIEENLANYSKEWDYLINQEHVFKTKCEELGYCTEKNSCGRMKRRDSND